MAYCARPRLVDEVPYPDRCGRRLGDYNGGDSSIGDYPWKGNTASRALLKGAPAAPATLPALPANRGEFLSNFLDL